MSAFVVSKAHVDAMVAAGLKHAGPYSYLSWTRPDPTGEDEEPYIHLDHTTKDEVGQMLWDENVRSVEHRYSPPGREAIYGEGFESVPDFELPGTYRTETIVTGVEPITLPEWAAPYTFEHPHPSRQLSPIGVLKAISCYEYQSCEHEGWQDSEAKRFCEALRSVAIHELPGYAEADWEVKS